jgi:hypothetical protein
MPDQPDPDALHTEAPALARCGSRFPPTDVSGRARKLLSGCEVLVAVAPRPALRTGYRRTAAVAALVGTGASVRAGGHSGPSLFAKWADMSCPLCDRYFPIHGVPCTEAVLSLPLHQREKVSYGRLIWTGWRPCPECGTSSGCPHHMPCVREYCPACCDGRKLTTCLQHGGEPVVVVRGAGFPASAAVAP